MGKGKGNGVKVGSGYVAIYSKLEEDDFVESLKMKVEEPAKESGKKAGKGIGDGVKDAEPTVESSFAKMTKVAGKALAVIGGTAAFAKFAKGCVSAYADYEQLTGGVETLFGNASQKVMGYAAESFKNVGISANDYMETVTSFSASMISSLGGDTKKAADMSNMAMVDMADNANKMGSNIADIQNAYQGFAKQNYTMLDNLKLGYGGTQQEMQRLLADAEKLSGKKFQLGNFADMTEAIHIVQTQLGITGTTAEEAATTISGSIGMAKASWSDFQTALASGDTKMIETSMNNLFKSIETMAKNLVPVITTVLVQIAKNLPALIGKALDALPGIVAKAVQSLIQSINKAFNIKLPIPDLKALTDLFKVLKPLIIGAAAAFVGLQAKAMAASIAGKLMGAAFSPQPLMLLAAAIHFFMQTETGQKIVKAAFEGIKAAITVFGQVVAPIFRGIAKVFMAVFVGTFKASEAICDGIFRAIKAVIEGAMNAIGAVITVGANLIKAAFRGIQVIVGVVTTIFNSVKNVIGSVMNAIGSFLNGAANNIKATFNGIKAVVGVIRGIFSNIHNAVQSTFGRTWSFIQGIVHKLKNAFSFSWHLPHLSLPHISVTGGKAPFGIGGHGSLPHFSIRWYANGAIMKKPTLFNARGNQLDMGGEAGDEAILPLENIKPYFREANLDVRTKADAEIINILAYILMYLQRELPDTIRDNTMQLTNRDFRRMVNA